MLAEWTKGNPVQAAETADFGSMSVNEGASPQVFLDAEQRGSTAPNGKPSKTIDEAGLHLVGGEPGWSAALGVSYAVTYAFRSTAPSTMPDDTSGFSRFSATQITQAELALIAWSDVANITFTRVGSGTSGEAAFSNSASILLANYASGQAGAAAFASYPGNPSFSSSSGDLWVNSTLSYNRNPVQGNYGGLVLVHELGHTIGLSHPGDYDASDDMPITYASDAEYYEDSTQYTVMSYFDETETGADYHGAYAAAPMLDDISAAQQEYGVNLATRTGDTVYGFNSTADRPWYLATNAATKLVFAVWDAGGVDTFDFSGFGVAQTIDLREGHFSSVGGLVGNVAIAEGAAIENVIGGAGADTIIGNGLSNILSGGGGDDSLAGGAGRDTLTGGLGADILEGGEDGDVFVVSQANHSQLGLLDRIVDFQTGVDRIDLRGASGDRVAIIQTNLGSEIYFSTDAQGAARSAISTKGVVQGSDILADSGAWFYMEGSGRGEALTGGANADLIVGLGGADVLTGGGGGDRFIIRLFSESSLSAGDTIIDFQTGLDRLVLTGVSGPVVALIQSAGHTDAFFAADQAGASRGVVTAVGELQGTDIDADPNTWFYMEGDATANRLQGGGMADILKSGGGADTLIGGGGADLLFGGQGADRFIVASPLDSSLSAADALLDFETGVDKLALTGETGAAVSVIMRGGSTSVFFGIDGSGASHGRVTAQGVLQASDIEAASSTWFYVEGSSGADTLLGGVKGDVFAGGAGSDHFVIQKLADSTLSSADRILDFVSGVDHLDLAFDIGSVVSLIQSGTKTDIYYALDAGGAARGKVTVNGAVQATDVNAGNATWFYMEGANGVDHLVGGANNDILKGQAGDDVLTGGAGADSLTGGSGADTFVFAAGFGHDTIEDYASGDILDAHALIDAGVHYTLSQVGLDTLIGFDTGDSIYVRNATTDLFHF
ncbi:hypothetical protein BH10PSE3_BH10PSE3_16220 [soil metagenome]